MENMTQQHPYLSRNIHMNNLEQEMILIKKSSLISEGLMQPETVNQNNYASDAFLQSGRDHAQSLKQKRGGDNFVASSSAAALFESSSSDSKSNNMLKNIEILDQKAGVQMKIEPSNQYGPLPLIKQSNSILGQ